MSLPYAGSANQIPYATSVGSQLAQIWLWDPSFSLNLDPEAPEKQLRDIVISGALDHLQRSIVGHEFSFEPEENDLPGRELAAIVEGLTKKQRFLPQALYNLSRATHRGAAWGLIYPERKILKLGRDKKPREWTIVAKIRDVDKRRFRLSQTQVLSRPDKGLAAVNPGLTWAGSLGPLAAPPDHESVRGLDMGALGNFRWEFHRGWDYRTSSSMWWTPIEDTASYDRWIQHVPDTSEMGMGYGYALADELQFYSWCKTTVMRYGLQGLERWGQGFLHAATKALRDGMAKGMSQATAMQNTLNTMRTWRSQNMAATDDNTTLQLLDMPATAAANVLEWIQYLDAELVKRILAALQPTGGKAGTGNYSSAKVEEGSSESMVLYLRSPLQETWTNNVVRFLIEHNEENLRELGLWDLGLPALRLQGRQQRDIAQMLQVFKLAAELKIPVRREDFYSTFGLAEPNEEDTVIEYPELVLPGGGAPGEAGGPPDPLGALGDDGFKARRPIGEGLSAVADRAA